MKNRDTKIIISFVFMILIIISGKVAAYKLNVNSLVKVIIPLVVWCLMGLAVFPKKKSRVNCKESLKKYIIKLGIVVALTHIIIIIISLYVDSMFLPNQIKFKDISIVSVLSTVIMIVFREGVRHYVIHGVNRNNVSNMVILSAVGISVSQINIDALINCQSFQSVFLFFSLSVLPIILVNIFISYLVWLNGAIEGIIYSTILSAVIFVSFPLVSITTGVLLIMPFVSILIVEKCYDMKVEQNWCKSKNKFKTYKPCYQYSMRQAKLI